MNFGAIQAIFLQLSWSQHKLAHSCQGRGQRSNGAINKNKHFFSSFCRGIANLVTPSLTVAELFQKEIYERKKETMRERERDTHTHTQRERQRERETEREREKERERHTHRERERGQKRRVKQNV